MKKILSIILVLCMLFTSCIAMTSCDLFGGSGSNETTDKGSDDTTTPKNDETTNAPDNTETTVPGGEQTTTPGDSDETTTPGDNNETTTPDDSDDDEPEDPKPSDSEEAQYLKKHAIALFNEGLNKTLVEFFDEADVYGTLCGMEKGAAHITVGNAMLTEQTGIEKIMESFYFDMTGGKFGAIASDTTVVANGETFDAFIYIDKNSVLASGNSIFGTDAAYQIDILEIVEDFKDSALKALLDSEDSGMDVEEITASLEMFVDYWSTIMDTPLYDEALSAEMLAWAESLLWTLDPVVTEEKVNGEDALRITYTINNKNIGKLLEAFFTTLPDAYFVKVAEMNSVLGGEISAEEMKAMIAEGYTEVLEAYGAMTMTVNVLWSFALATDGSLLDITVVSNLEDAMVEEDVTYEWKVEPTVSITFGEDAIVFDLAFDYTAGENTIAGEVVLTTTRTEKDGIVTFRSDLDVTAYNADGEMDKKEDVIEITAIYEKVTGAYSIGIKAKSESYIYDEETDEYIPTEYISTVGIAGTLCVKDGKITLTVDSAASNDYEMLDIGVKIEIDPTAEMPEIPADAVNVLEQTEEEWMALVDSIMESPFWMIIDSMGGSHGESETMVAFRLGTCVSEYGDYYTFNPDGTFVYCDPTCGTCDYTVSGKFAHGDHYEDGVYYGSYLTLLFMDEYGEMNEFTCSIVNCGEYILINGEQYVYENDFSSNFGNATMGTLPA